MPTLLLSSRQTEDAQKLWRACIAENWKVVRLHGWRVPYGCDPVEVLPVLRRACSPIA